MLRVLYLLAIVVASFATKVTKNAPKSGPVTDAPAGRVLGSWMETRQGRRFEAYRGVRYAKPPVGELRFQPPQDILNYTKDMDAREEGPACPLVAPPEYYVDEDCLRLNVYTPKNRKISSPMPVIFFVHPGGFYSMTGRSDLAGPHYLMERDVVLVTINYRLGALGFLSTGDKWAPGNNGLKDQVAALRWVQRNIRAFGGDPGLVTVAGVSAGSYMAMLNMVSPMTKGLFHRAISISGSPISKEPMPVHQKDLAEKQARILGCPTGSSKAIVDCLKTKPWRELGDSYPKFFEIGYDPVGIWGPVVEPKCGQERYLDRDPAVAIQNGDMHAVPHIISQTTDEFSWFALIILKNESLVARMNAEWDRLAPISFALPPNGVETKLARLKKEYLNDKPLVNDEASYRGMGGLYADSIMGFPINRMVHLMAQHSPKPVYYYQFAYIGQHSHYEDPDTKKPVGCMHHDDMIYLLTLSYRFPTIPLGSEDDKIVQRMTAIWYNFARYGDPNPRGDTPELGCLSWPPVKPNDRKYLKIDKEFSVLSNLKEDKYKLWEELYPLRPWTVPQDTCLA
ncbi:hypothetical protein O0L34_g1767 [Tuta absoluta]|nr:hypothetical protein O0L34_g1767 [Tuta absoluta]